MLWTEKYRPSKLTEIRGQTNFTTDAYNWIEENTTIAEMSAFTEVMNYFLAIPS